jgi:hypothetical protein
MVTDGKTGVVMLEKRKLYCMASEFIATDPYLNPTKGGADGETQKCEIQNYDCRNNAATWEMTCVIPGIGKLTSKIDATVSAQEFNLTMINGVDSTQLTRVRTVGSREGECTAGMELLKP